MVPHCLPRSSCLALCLVVPVVPSPSSWLSPSHVFSFFVFGAMPLSPSFYLFPVVTLLPVPLSLVLPRCSPFPLHEQLLGAVVRGALLVVAVVVPPSFPSRCPLLPPREQMLAAAVEGAVVVVAVVVVFPSPSFVVVVFAFSFSLSSHVLSLFRPPRRCRRPLAPPIHPASSCSLRWEGVLVVLVAVVAGVVVVGFLFVLVVFLCLRCRWP